MKTEINVALKLQKAYILLKKSFYYENNSLLHIKYQITKFEAKNNLLDENSRSKFFSELANTLFNENFIKNLLNKISYKKIIKKFDENEIENKDKIKYNYIIDCPIELHLISLLWILDSGVELDKKIVKNSYGYRLENDKNKSIFKKYIIQYYKWLENGLEIAQDLVERNEDIVLLKMDLKRYYYNISEENLITQIKKLNNNIEDNNLFNIILKINKKYTELLKLALPQEEKEGFGEYFLPIGLYSSAVLANFYLKEFDENILNCYPDYYGRYVDDIFIILRERNTPTSTDAEEYLKNRFPEVFNKEYLSNLKLNFDFKNNNKIIMKTLSGNLKKIKFKEVKEKFLEKPSPFNFLPNEKEIKKLYEKIALSENKEIREQKFDVSIYLSKILDIFHSVQEKEFKTELEKLINDIIYFFNEENIIKYSIYFQKIFSILLLNNNPSLFINLFSQLEKTLSEYSEDIKEYFNLSLKFALSLNLSFVKKNEKYFINSYFIKDYEEFQVFIEEILNIVNSNMFQGDKVVFPLLNYIKFNDDQTEINFLSDNLFDLKFFKENQLELDEEKLKLSPRFIHFNEIGIFLFRKEIINILKEKETKEDIFNKTTNYFKLNFLESKLKNEQNKEIFKELFSYYKINQNLDFIKFDTKVKRSKFKIGIVSFIVKEKELLDNLDGNQNLTLNKKERLIKILNEAKENSVDILVFSETSIPIQWLKFMSKFSRENQMIITGGLDHIFLNDTKKNVGNFLFTIVPFDTQKYKTSFIKFRLKNYYAPGERKQIIGRKFNIPILKEKKYDIFSWKGLYFSNFNCFELADIESRGLVKNYIDLLIASVFNKDINYFTNILESTCRDLYVYIAQSNTSIYGDCKILQPSKKDLMTKASISGGLNDNLLIEEINIENLRNFQLLDYILQEENKYFKLTPPNLDVEAVKARKENELNKYLIKKYSKEKYLKIEEKDKELLKYLIDSLSENELNDILKFKLTVEEKIKKEKEKEEFDNLFN